jgi:hypothetical protein
MAKVITTSSPVKVITSGNVPTTSTLGNGGIAVGKINGRRSLYFGVGSEVLDFSPDVILTVYVNHSTGLAGNDGLTQSTALNSVSAAIAKYKDRVVTLVVQVMNTTSAMGNVVYDDPAAVLKNITINFSASGPFHIDYRFVGLDYLRIKGDAGCQALIQVESTRFVDIRNYVVIKSDSSFSDVSMLQFSSCSFAAGSDVEIAGSNVQFISSVSFNSSVTLYLTRGATLDFNNAVSFSNRESSFIFGDAGCRVTGKITSSIGDDWNPFAVRDYAEAQGVVVRVGKNAGYKDVAEWRLPEPKAKLKRMIIDTDPQLGSSSPQTLQFYTLEKNIMRPDEPDMGISVRVMRMSASPPQSSSITVDSFDFIDGVTGWMYPADDNSPNDRIGIYNIRSWLSSSSYHVYLIIDYVE